MSDISTGDSNTPNDDTNPENFQVGGIDRELSDVQQLEQLVSYFDAHYPLPSFAPPWAGGDGDPEPADRYVGKLPDRTTHAAMLMLGSAVDHSMPGVAFIGDVSVSPVPEVGGALFTPSEPTGRWAVSFHSGGWWRGAGDALEFQWRPEVAAAAELSGTTILDLDYPLAPDHTLAEMNESVGKAVGYARHHNASSITGWGYSSGAALAVLNASLFDVLVLTYPDFASVGKLPDEVRGSSEVSGPSSWPTTLVQVALQDEIAPRPTDIDDAPNVTVEEYVSQHRISTPKVARERVKAIAEFLRGI